MHMIFSDFIISSEMRTWWKWVRLGEKKRSYAQTATLLMGIGDHLYNMWHCCSINWAFEVGRCWRPGDPVHTARRTRSTLVWLYVLMHPKPFSTCTTQHPASIPRVRRKWRDLRLKDFVVLTFFNGEEKVDPNWGLNSAGTMIYGRARELGSQKHNQWKLIHRPGFWDVDEIYSFFFLFPSLFQITNHRCHL